MDYDGYGRVILKEDANLNVILTYAYDANDRPTNRWSAAKGNLASDPVCILHSSLNKRAGFLCLRGEILELLPFTTVEVKRRQPSFIRTFRITP